MSRQRLRLQGGSCAATCADAVNFTAALRPDGSWADVDGDGELEGVCPNDTRPAQPCIPACVRRLRQAVGAVNRFFCHGFDEVFCVSSSWRRFDLLFSDQP